MGFKGVDFYRVDDLLTDEERMVRDTVRRFVDRGTRRRDSPQRRPV